MQFREMLQGWRDQARLAGQDIDQYLLVQTQADPSILAQVADCVDLVLFDAEALSAYAPSFELIPVADALALRVLPLEIDGAWYVVLASPFDRAVRDDLLLRFFGEPVVLAMSAPGAVEQRLDAVASRERAIDGVEIDASDEGAAALVESISLTSIGKDENPVIRLVNSTLYDALQSRASDIHIEARAEGLAIRYRIDGVLQSIRQIPGRDTASQTLSRIKVMAMLDIAEKRVPQDGRFKVEMMGREIDFRTSIMPGSFGENAVLRLLDRSARCGRCSLDVLDFDAHTAARIRSLAARPYGLTLVTGPTGSGKSTTLYAVLTEVNTGDSKIITIEDPVEYELDGVLQIPVNERKGLTFARGLRSILRHDPDTIMVGEIRDADTASIAVQSALTGHRVLSTVHANDGFSVIDRFIYMGVEPSTFMEALNGVVSQRLVRRLCPQCAPAHDRDEDLLSASLDELRRAVQPGPGCDTCRGTGYQGRIALAEVLMLDGAMKAALLDKSMERRLQALANDAGYRPIHEAGVAAIRRRQTTFQEVQRAIAVE